MNNLFNIPEHRPQSYSERTELDILELLATDTRIRIGTVQAGHICFTLDNRPYSIRKKPCSWEIYKHFPGTGNEQFITHIFNDTLTLKI